METAVTEENRRGPVGETKVFNCQIRGSAEAGFGARKIISKCSRWFYAHHQVSPAAVGLERTREKIVCTVLYSLPFKTHCASCSIQKGGRCTTLVGTWFGKLWSCLLTFWLKGISACRDELCCCVTYGVPARLCIKMDCMSGAADNGAQMTE